MNYIAIIEDDKALNNGIVLAANDLEIDDVMGWIWTDGAEYVDENALSVTVNRLRKKMDAAEVIRTVYGIGYVWSAKGR